MLSGVNRTGRWAIVLLVAGLASDVLAYSTTVKLSPWNASRPKRRMTTFIVLHTTEGPMKGSLEKVYRNGEAHYFIDQAGHVTVIMDRDRVATHAGRSLWNGLYDLDQYSVGVEVVGYYNRPITPAQVNALRGVIADLKRIYRVPDERILTHSMVAYGAPNRWHSQSHRGRKRCGMLFARIPVRRQLGLKAEPAFDPDVRAGRVMNADPQLAGVLYGSGRNQNIGVSSAPVVGVVAGEGVIGPGCSAWDLARDAYNQASTTYVFPSGERKRGNEIRNWKSIPAGTRVILSPDAPENMTEGLYEVGEKPEAATVIAGREALTPTTIYCFPDGTTKGGHQLTPAEQLHLPTGTRILAGYVPGGAITRDRSAFNVCGGRWNLSTTLYRFPDGQFHAGNRVNEKRIPIGTQVFYCR
ncbi:MAG: hypothetical protein A2340_02875 [Lentisphaerae bacterium RIFOXYB12_FULL_60_10]|nr:MAG: hypothetical protein A2340_02875 [Lentisphaerae bacterium RIFOXYB12_FULL_60_10]